MPIVTRDQWEEFVQTFPQAHIMQTAGWGELKESPSWNHIHVVNDNNGAQILIRTIVMNYTMAYIPKGPLGQDWSSLWPEIDAVCKAKNVVFLKVEPDVYEEDRLDLQRQGFKASKQNIQPRRTIVIDIRKDEKDILAAMKQKTRYNIRLAEKQGVVVKPSTDLHVFHNLLRVTAERDEFGVHTLEYYQKVYQLFNSTGQGELLIAEYQGEPLAGLILLYNGKRAWYMYGASNNQHREKMPTYLIQWEAICQAKNHGCTEYDLWGVPDYDVETLEAQFSDRNDGLWGVYRFKRGFGGQVRRFSTAWDRVYKPFPYFVYSLIVSVSNLKNSI